jgi:hypothetical protein
MHSFTIYQDHMQEVKTEEDTARKRGWVSAAESQPLCCGE